MRVKLKLFASLRQYLPEHPSGVVELELAPGATPQDLILQYALPREQVHLVLVNGFYVTPEALGESVLEDGDEIALWPPVAGG